MAEEETQVSKTDDTDKLKRSLKVMRILTAVSAVLIVILLGFMLLQPGEGATGGFIALTEEEIGEQTVNFINQNLVQQGEASLVSVEDTSGVYKVTVLYQNQEVPLFVSKDGGLLFQGTIDMTETVEQPEQPEQPQEQPAEVVRTDNPEVHAFVMSYCPFGLQFMKAYIPVLELLNGKADMELNFVHYIMHGEKEIQENNRMYCIQRDEPDKFTDYLRCFVETDDWEGCYDKVGINKATVDACISEIDSTYKITELYNDESTWSGGRYPQYPVDATLANQFGVRGSPTFVVNGKTISVNRSPEAIKQAVCSAFNSPPSECEQTLSTSAEAPGIGAIGSGSNPDSGSAQCG